ncbi:MAG TPA: hypothetical protein VEJ86_10950 [Candidatus Binataceae bacterium]|nr:hypothetical protein [Candidatus Binataceae bacterium]
MILERIARGVRLAALAAAFAIAGCNYQEFLAAQNAPIVMPTLPAQPPEVVPLSNQLEGDWSATYPRGPLHVNIQDDPLLGDHNYVARLVDGSYGEIHPGAITFKGRPDNSIPNLVGGEQMCSQPGRMGLLHAPMTITVQDSNHFTEQLVRAGACPGFPVRFTRIANAWAPPSSLPSK